MGKLFLILSAALLVCALETGCVRLDRHSVVRPSDVNSSPLQFSQRHIIISGYLNIGPESRIIYESRRRLYDFRRGWRSSGDEFSADQYDRYCLTVANPEEVLRQRPSLRNGSIVASGRFVSNYYDVNSIVLGACPLPGAFIIERIIRPR